MVGSAPSSLRDLPGTCGSGSDHHGILAHDVLDHLVQDFRLYRLLNKVSRALLQRRNDVFLVADRRDHDYASMRMLAHDALGCLDTLHLGHGDVHQDDVGRNPIVFGDGGAAVTGFTGHQAAESLDHARKVLARKNGIVHYQVTDWLSVLRSKKSRELLHTCVLNWPCVSAQPNLILLHQHARFLAALRYQRVCQSVEWNDSHNIAAINRGTRHSVY